MEQELNTIVPEIEDMPDFGEETAKEEVTQTETETTETEVKEETETEETKEEKISQPEQRILDEMNRRVSEGDELLATAMQSKDKSIKECYRYVTFLARKEMEKVAKGYGSIMIDDPVVYGWAHHYYIESKETIDKEMKPKETPKPATPTATAKKPTAKTTKKGKEKPKTPANVLDITKAIVAPKATETGKKGRKEKKKDSLKAGFVPMERPDTIKDAKKGSREQAKSIVQMDMFADFFAE